MRLILVRHGETEGNVKRLIQGHLHGKLTKKGREQAKKLAHCLKNEKIDVIYSSDMKRAKDTAKEIAKYHKAPVIFTREIRERHYGKLEGRKGEEMKKLRIKSGKPRYLFRPDGGESFVDLTERADKFLKKIYKKHKGKNVLLVGHGNFIKMLLGIALGSHVKYALRRKLSNASISIIELNDNGHKVHVINSTRHL